MKSSDFRWPVLGVLIALFILCNVMGSVTLGLSAEWSDDAYRYSGGTAAWALGSSLFILAFYFWLMVEPPGSPGLPMPGLFRRWVAFWIDFFFAIMAICPLFGLIPSIVEWKHTGVFEWTFERTTPLPGDVTVVLVTLLLMFLALVAYFVFPLVRARPSLGSCICGYRVTVADGVPMSFRRAVLRTLVGFFAAATGFIAALLVRDKHRGQFWLDTVFKTQAVLLK